MGRNFRANSRTRVLSLCVLAIACSLAVSGCDNDRTGRGRNDGVSDAPVRIAGTVQANQVEGATVVASVIEANGTVGAVLGQAVTDADGRYTLALNAGFDGYSGPVFLTATGGTYTSEGTGNGSVTLNATFSAVLSSLKALDPNSGSLPQNANITILTTLSAQMALRSTGGITEANVNAANAAIQNAFGGGFDILETGLVDPTTASSDPVSAASADYTLLSAAFAQLAADLSQTETAQFNIRIADIIDGRLDGKAPTINPDPDSAVVLLINRALARFVASSRNARALALSSATQSALNKFDGNFARDTVPGLDVIAPKIGERFPVPGSTNLPLNTRIFVKADEELNPS
ncbi:MAG: hypothetical protein P1V97_39190, partial [Planctomycetota bacterium]|nr:hypothetical protein [Planctomycetota bacterium]